MENLADLQGRRNFLRAKLSGLRADPDAVMVEARSLGLYKEGDGVLILQESDSYSHYLDGGQMMRLAPLKQTDETFIAVLACAVGISAVLVSLITGRSRDAHRAK